MFGPTVGSHAESRLGFSSPRCLSTVWSTTISATPHDEHAADDGERDADVVVALAARLDGLVVVRRRIGIGEVYGCPVFGSRYWLSAVSTSE